MKIFIHRGKGHYTGSVCIVKTEDIDQATQLVLEWLDANDLVTEAINITEVHETANYIYTNNGDY